MEEHVTSILTHIAASHEEMDAILAANRDITVHMASMIIELPDKGLTFTGMDTVTRNALLVTENITSYVKAIAELEEAIADSLSAVMKELNGGGENEE